MSGSQKESPRIEHFDDLLEFFTSGCKPPEQWKIGTEHEKFGFNKADLTPVPYDGPNGIKALLEGLQQRHNWEPVLENGNIVSLLQSPEQGGGSITLEPGGQFELSGAPLDTLHQTCDEVHTHLEQVREIGNSLGIGFLGLGFSPKWSYEETPMMPKGRYRIMRDYMKKVGTLGTDMMFRSATVQVNLDYESEADMVQKLRVALALQPIVTAIFANSPFTEGKPSGYLSYRSRIWLDTDADRSGMLPFTFEDSMGFERYVEYALDVPMYFIYRDGVYNDVSGLSFRDFLKGELKGFVGKKPTVADWTDHLTTLFPEARVKKIIEMRGADSVAWRGLCALPAIWVGLLYDKQTLDKAYDLIADWTETERQNLRNEVPKQALNTPFRDGKVLDVARTIVGLSREGLKRRQKLDRFGEDETHFLNSIETIVEDGMTTAEDLLERFYGRWEQKIDRVFDECAY